MKNTNTLSAQEVVAHLRRALRAEITITAEGPVPYKGEAIYEMGDWRVWIFYYEGRLDYCDRVSAPNGRAGGYADWADTNGDGNPVSLLSTEEALALERIFNRAHQPHQLDDACDPGC
ncbi:DUF7693 family protein [Comamonas sp. 4034]|uniref:DUF7693 family protein n=1 Tax=Comamonas sp. 4034 TaxID=3156455 RepID=UPI003D23F111